MQNDAKATILPNDSLTLQDALWLHDIAEHSVDAEQTIDERILWPEDVENLKRISALLKASLQSFVAPIDAAAPVDGGSWLQKPCEYFIGSGCYGTITWWAKADGSTPVPRFCTTHSEPSQQASGDALLGAIHFALDYIDEAPEKAKAFLEGALKL